MRLPPTISRWERFAIALATLSAVCAFMVLVGWWTGSRWLIQPIQDTAYVRFNTALSLLATSLAFVALIVRRKGLAAAIAALPLFLSFGALLEWATNRSVGIDQMFVSTDLVNSQTPVAGRTSVLAALCFTALAGAIFWCRIFANRPNIKAGLLRVSSVAVAATTFVTLISVVTRVNLSGGWLGINQMSPVSAFCFCTLGCVGYILSLRKSETLLNSSRWTALAVSLGIASGTLVWWQAELSNERGQMKEAMSSVSASIQEALKARVTLNAEALARMASRIASGTEPTYSSWVKDARNYKRDFPEYQAVEWIDSSLHIRWVEPIKGNEAAVGLNLTFEARRRAAIARALSGAPISMSQTVDLVQGGRGYLIYSPVVKNGRVAGIVAGVCHVDATIKTLPFRIRQLFGLQFYDEGQTIYDDLAHKDVATSWATTSKIKLEGATWTLRVSPTKRRLATLITSFPTFILVTGLAIALLAGVAVLLWGRAAETAQSELRTKRFLQTLSETAATVTYVVDIDERCFTYGNGYASQFLGVPIEEFIGGGEDLIARIVHPDDLTFALNHFDQFGLLPPGAFMEFEQRVRGAEGDWRWLLHRERVLEFREDGTPRLVLGTAQDVTEHHTARESMRQSKEVLEKVLDYASIGMALVAPDGKWLYVNESLCDIVGYNRQDLLASDFQAITHPDDLDADMTCVERMLKGEIKTYSMEKRYFHRDGHIVYILLSVSLVRTLDGEPLYFVSQIQDISERKEGEQRLREYSEILKAQTVLLSEANTRLEQTANTDGLTHLRNRRAFDILLSEHLSLARRYNESLSLIILDVDKFKSFNDDFGHLAGDDVLTSVASILEATHRKSDFVARFGGEEFVVLCPHASAEQAGFAAERLRKAIEEAKWPLRQVTASFGVASLTPAMHGAADLIRAADAALYASKESGRNRVTGAGEDKPVPSEYSI